MSDRSHSDRADRLRLVARLVTSVGSCGTLQNVEHMWVEAMKQMVSCDRSYYVAMDHEEGTRLDDIAAPGPTGGGIA